MVRTVVRIDGMMCRMCEKHMSESFVKSLKAKSVFSSHEKGQSEIISENAPDEEEIKSLVEEAGYKFISCKSEPYEKKKFSLFGNK